jgi:hypothetical protein
MARAKNLRASKMPHFSPLHVFARYHEKFMKILGKAKAPAKFLWVGLLTFTLWLRWDSNHYFIIMKVSSLLFEWPGLYRVSYRAPGFSRQLR